VDRRSTAGLGLAAATAWAGPALAPRVPVLADVLALARHVPSPDGVALTFDDGPHRAGTPAVLELLREHAATATFFLVGEQVRRTGALREEILAAGHAIAIHGDRHRNFLRLGPGAVRDELDRAAESVGARALPVHRAPYGIYTPAVIWEVRRRGWTPLLWSRWGRDWRARTTAPSIATEVTRGLRGGDVLLLHDADDYSARGSWQATVAALPRVLETITLAGLRTVAIPPGRSAS
jgi:peptidoglycan/xylan/chitin deacetylase (PgdA/CDA1 family)